jgi:urease accessory protein UreH
VIERVRYDGVARCSRTFRRDGAALVMLSTLGPGIVRGDSLEICGTVGPDAHLIVTEQTATRVLGGAASSRIDAAWTVASGATLEFSPEPIIAQSGGDAMISTTIDCAPDATVVVRDLASVSNGARIRLRTLVRVAGRDALYDSIEIGADAPPAIGTVVVIGGSPDVDLLDALATSTSLRVGVGVLSAGLFVRVLGPAVWPVRELQDAMCATIATHREKLAGGSHPVGHGGIANGIPLAIHR